MAGSKYRNGGKWTEAEYNKRIAAAFREVSRYWYPAQQVLKAAKVGKDLYQCAACGEIGPEYLPPLPGLTARGNKRKKRKNAIKDHINPVIDPATGGLRADGSGLMDWNRYADRLFIEDKQGFQILCNACHTKKSREEGQRRKP